MRWPWVVVLGWMVLPVAAAQLTLDLGSAPRTLDSAALLARSQVREITIDADVAYGRAMRYRALPLRALLAGVDARDHLQFVARDGFVAEIPAALVWNERGSSAWLAIEDADAPWPPLPGKVASAGPFYLVWTHPQAARIGPERWPYQLAAIRRLPDVMLRFPALSPDPALGRDDPVRHGLDVFVAHCLSCHTLNAAGDATLGPDLNLPYSPTEYLRADLLRTYLRDPQRLRRWPQARMPGFDAASLPEADLDALLAYLRHMAARRRATSSPQP